MHWKTVGQEDFSSPGQSVEYPLLAQQDWQDVSVELPVKGTTQIVRLHLPADKAPVDLQLIEFTGPEGKVRAWDFSNSKAE